MTSRESASKGILTTPLFKRRQPVPISKILAASFRKPSVILRSARYHSKRFARMRSSPHAIALGFALGVFVSFTPLIGFHLVLALFLAWILRADLLAAAIGTVVGNPITFPFIWIAAYALGAVILNQPPASISTISDVQSYFLPLITGGFILGLLAAAFSYPIIRASVLAYKKNRKQSPKDKNS